MDKEKYLKPRIDSTDVEIGVYGTYQYCQCTHPGWFFAAGSTFI